MATKQCYTTAEVLQELAMDSDSDMEPEEDFLPDGYNFVAENSGEAVLDEPVLFIFMKKVWKVFT